jgi:hypothetical protein
MEPLRLLNDVPDSNESREPSAFGIDFFTATASIERPRVSRGCRRGGAQMEPEGHYQTGPWGRTECAAVLRLQHQSEGALSKDLKPTASQHGGGGSVGPR